jgi:hypothetical protein
MNVSRPSSEVQQLIKAGQAALEALNSGSPDVIQFVEAYADAFDAWEQSGNLESPDHELGMRIAEQHATIVKLLESVKGDAALALVELRDKGKGLRAYTDVFPRRISTMKPTKG